jgi:hypothetical protein
LRASFIGSDCLLDQKGLLKARNTGYGWLFFLLRVHCIAPGCSTFQGVSRSVNVISIKDFADSFDVLLCSTIFLVLESTLAFQRSCIFKSNCWNEIKDVRFWKDLLKIKLFGQRPNTRHSKYTVLLLSCILKTEIDPL